MLTLALLGGALAGCSSSVYLPEPTVEGKARAAEQAPLVCGLQLSTERYFTPSGRLPTIWARQDDPVFVRLYTSDPALRWNVELASSRVYAGLADESARVTIREGHTQMQSAAGVRLHPNEASKVRERCGGDVHYHDIVIDDGIADRSLVYALNIAFASETDTLSYPINVQRYRASYFELATGPVVAVDADVPSYSLVPTGTEGERVLRRAENALGTQVVIGGLLRPWGYNPLREGRGQHRYSNAAFYLATSLTDRTFDTVYGGLAYGARGITVAGGAVVYGTREPVSAITLDEPFLTTADTDDVAEVTQKSFEVGWFVGLQLDTSLFARFSGDN